MTRRSGALGLLLAVVGCAETVNPTALDASVPRAPDASPISLLPPTDQCASGMGAPSPDLGLCHTGILSVPVVAMQMRQLYDAVRADGDNTAVFWSDFVGDPYAARLLVQRFDARGAAVDAQPVVLMAAPDFDSTVTTSWDHDTCEPVVLVTRALGEATFRVGGLHREATTRTFTMRDANSGQTLNQGRLLRSVEGGWTFFAQTDAVPTAPVQVLLTPAGELRTTRSLAAIASGPVGYAVDLLDGTFLATLPSTATTTSSYQRFDARGEPLGPVVLWDGVNGFFAPPLGATTTGYLLTQSAPANGAAITAYDFNGRALGLAHAITPPDPRGFGPMVGAHGHAFFVGQTSTNDTYVQPVTALGALGAPLSFATLAGAPVVARMVPTSLGGMLVCTSVQGAPGFFVTLVALRVCD